MDDDEVRSKQKSMLDYERYFLKIWVWKPDLKASNIDTI